MGVSAGSGRFAYVRGDIPHGPEKLMELPIHFLSIIVYGGQDDE